jgi:hypothetical protein
MRNWRMWLAAITTNLLFYKGFWVLNPTHVSGFLDLRWFESLLFQIAFNFVVAFLIVI